MPQLPASSSPAPHPPQPAPAGGNTRRQRWALGLGLLALAALVLALWQLELLRQGVSVSTTRVGTAPVTVFRPAAPPGAGAPPPPVVLVAHGFAGSQQLMQPLALTLARNGLVAITFDFPGHGRHPGPLRGGLSDPDASLRTLMAAMADLGGHAQDLARQHGGNGRYAVLGHSMASDIAVRHAQAQAQQVQATVGVSLFAPSVSAGSAPDSPRNLLVVAGALEPGMMADEALRVVGVSAAHPAVAALAAGQTPALDTTYGQFADGTARRASLAPGVEHIGVLYSGHTLHESLAWLRSAFDLPPLAQPVVDRRGPWLGLLLLGVLVLGWALAQALPRLQPAHPAHRPRLAWWGWRGQALLCVLPAVLTPLLLWRLPSDLLPILLGDYLVLHFALYGLLTALGLRLLVPRALRTLHAPPTAGQGPALATRAGLAALLVAVLATSAYALLAVGWPLDRYVFSLQPPSHRWPMVLALLAGTLPYFLADEWLSRRAGAPRGAYGVSKLCFLLSLVLAIALNPPRLFFLAIIVPAILLLFVLYGWFSRWVAQSTGQPLVAAVANALVFAGFMAATFPMVA